MALIDPSTGRPRCGHLRRLPPSTVRTRIHQTTPARHLSALPNLGRPSSVSQTHKALADFAATLPGCLLIDFMLMIARMLGGSNGRRSGTIPHRRPLVGTQRSAPAVG